MHRRIALFLLALIARSLSLPARASFARPVLVHLRRDLRDGAIPEDIRPRQIRAQPSTNVRRELPGDDRAPANLEEIIVQTDGARVHSKRLGPRLGNRALRRRQRPPTGVVRLLRFPDRTRNHPLSTF